MSDHTIGREVPDEQSLAQALNQRELVRLGEFAWELTVRLGDSVLPQEVEDADSFHTAWPLAPANYLPLGQSVREIYVRVGEPRRHHAPWHGGRLFWDALTEAIAFLHDERKNRITHVDAQGEHSDPAPPPRAVPIDYMAKFIIECSFEDGRRIPSSPEQEARVQFALAMDPLCAEAHWVQGQQEEGAGDFHRARIYIRARHEVSLALFIGPQAVASAEAGQAGEVHFSSASDASRAYVAHAHLWPGLCGESWVTPGERHLCCRGCVLEPDDRLDTRHALLCCLLEADEIETLGITLGSQPISEAYEYRGRDDHRGLGRYLLALHPRLLFVLSLSFVLASASEHS